MTGRLVVTRQGARFGQRRLCCSVGRTGFTADKREGDGATPVGLHRIVGLLYRPDRMARPAPWAKAIGPSDLWSDDPADPARYNHPVRAPYAGSHERLRRADPMYDAVLVTDWNWPDAVPGRGSAIFLHAWRRPRHGTAGCIAFARSDLLWLLPLLPPGSRVAIRG